MTNPGNQLGFCPQTDVPPLPLEVSAQTRLARHIHAPHKARRDRVLRALWETGKEREKNWAFRLAQCCSTGLVAQDKSTGKVWPWLNRCGSRLCPFCGRGRARRITNQLVSAISSFSEPKHLILTARSNNTPLRDQLAQLRLAFKKLRRHPEWTKRVRGGIYAIELTRNPATGLWHPHLHVLVDSTYFPQQMLVRLWSEAVGDTAHPWIRRIESRAKACREISKYVGQLPSLDSWPDSAIVEYAHAVHRVRMLQSFGKAYAPVLPDAEEKPAEKPDTWTVSLSQLTNAAAAGVAVAVDLCRLMWSRWPMLRRYIDARAPPLGVDVPLETNPGLRCPLPPTLRNGLVGAITDPEDLQALDDGLELTMLLLRGQVDAGLLNLADYWRAGTDS